MRMEFVFNKEKSVEKKMDLKKCYERLDDYFDQRGIQKIGCGMYCGDNLEDGGREVFLEAHRYLENESWFFLVVDSWGCMNSDSQYVLKVFVHGN
ncbi:MAG: hypothetical protein J6E46_08770 [Faecalicoccus sp.]|nr:hypothetical protein [Faecalicoccus sp.]